MKNRDNSNSKFTLKKMGLFFYYIYDYRIIYYLCMSSFKIITWYSSSQCVGTHTLDSGVQVRRIIKNETTFNQNKNINFTRPYDFFIYLLKYC